MRYEINDPWLCLFLRKIFPKSIQYFSCLGVIQAEHRQALADNQILLLLEVHVMGKYNFSVVLKIIYKVNASFQIALSLFIIFKDGKPLREINQCAKVSIQNSGWLSPKFSLSVTIQVARWKNLDLESFDIVYHLFEVDPLNEIAS